jgi:hypothetical protein
MKFVRTCWKTPRRKVATVLVLMSLSAGAAFAAAWFTGTLGGSAGGTVAGAQSIGAITLTPIGNNTALAPGGSSDAAFDVSNPTGHTVTVTTVNVGAITASPSCDTSAISFSGAGIVGLSFPAGSTTGVHVPGAWSATSGLSAGCQNAGLTVALSGTTNGS